MKTFLDNVIRSCTQQSRVWLACAFGLALLTFILMPGQGAGGALPSQAAKAELINERGCMPTLLKGEGDRLSGDDIARIVAQYVANKRNASRSARIEAVKKFSYNEKFKCDGSTTEERESICFRGGERKLCLPFEQ
jgi:hypothetical protein